MVTIVITYVRGFITPLIANHDPPSRWPWFWALAFSSGCLCVRFAKLRGFQVGS